MFSPLAFEQTTIVTNGLVLNLDASDRTSYPTTGTTWRDLSGTGNNGTLTNGPTFNSGNGGSIVFDGVDDYGSFIINFLSLGYTQITVETWFKPTTTGAVMIFENSPNWNANPGGFGLAINVDGNNPNPNLCHTAYWNGGNITARNYAFTCGTTNYSCHVNIYSNISDPTGRLTYVNGNLLSYTSTGGFPTSTATSTGSSFGNFTTYLSSRGGSTVFFNGNTAVIRLYNRKLTSSEITKNFQATRARFGI